MGRKFRKVGKRPIASNRTHLLSLPTHGVDRRLTARSAYRLRVRSPAFAAAWDSADQLAVGRLSALAFGRAINGRTEQVWHEGNLIAEKRLPSDRLLMWLLARLNPRRFAAPWELRKDGAADPQLEARASFPGLLDALGDIPSD